MSLLFSFCHTEQYIFPSYHKRTRFHVGQFVSEELAPIDCIQTVPRSHPLHSHRFVKPPKTSKLTRGLVNEGRSDNPYRRTLHNVGGLRRTDSKGSLGREHCPIVPLYQLLVGDEYEADKLTPLCTTSCSNACAEVSWMGKAKANAFTDGAVKGRV